MHVIKYNLVEYPEGKKPVVKKGQFDISDIQNLHVKYNRDDGGIAVSIEVILEAKDKDILFSYVARHESVAYSIYEGLTRLMRDKSLADEVEITGIGALSYEYAK